MNGFWQREVGLWWWKRSQRRTGDEANMPVNMSSNPAMRAGPYVVLERPPQERITRYYDEPVSSYPRRYLSTRLGVRAHRRRGSGDIETRLSRKGEKKTTEQKKKR